MEKGLQYAPETSSPSADIASLSQLILQYAQGNITFDAYCSQLDTWLAANKDTWQEKDLYELFQLSMAK